MNTLYSRLFLSIIVTLWSGIFFHNQVLAGNDTKRGQNGASELLINPWARSTGWNGANVSLVRGVESMNLNMGGLSYVTNSEVIIAQSRYLAGSDIRINSIGLGQRLSPTGVLGITFTSMSLGDFIETTTARPEGTGNTFSPQSFNIGVGYSKTFSRSIAAGIQLRTLYQSISNINALGVSFDAGIQYRAGKNDAFKFGVSIRNLGPKMSYSGEGLTFRSERDNIGLTVQSRSNPAEMPSQLMIGTSYDIPLGSPELRLTPAFSFTNNSYSKDAYSPGIEFAFREIFMVRGSYNLGNTLAEKDQYVTDVYTGVAAGGTLQIPLNKFLGRASSDDFDPNAPVDPAVVPTEVKKRDITIGLDYSFRATAPFNGTHNIGFVLNL
jgi:hypothetical protein